MLPANVLPAYRRLGVILAVIFTAANFRIGLVREEIGGFCVLEGFAEVLVLVGASATIGFDAR